MLHSLCVFKGFLINHLNFVKFGDHKKRKIYVYFLQVSCMCYYVILFSSRTETRRHHRRCRRRWNPLRHPNNYMYSFVSFHKISPH